MFKVNSKDTRTTPGVERHYLVKLIITAIFFFCDSHNGLILQFLANVGEQQKK